MTDHDDELDLKALWQSTPPVDLDELLNHVASERRRMRNFLWFEIVGGIISLAVVWGYYFAGVLLDMRVPIVITAIAVACQIWMWRWRGGQWNAVSEAPLDLLELQLKRAHTTLRIGKYYAWGTPIAAVAGLLLAFLPIFSVEPIDLAPGVRIAILIGLLAMIVGLTWFGVRMMRRARAQIKTLSARIDALRNGDH